MAITEDKRNDLFNAATRALGREEATTLMEHLPPVGWADVATKSDLGLLRQDLAGLEERIGLRFEVQEARFEAVVERSMREQAGRYAAWMVGLLTVVIAIQGLFAAVA